MKEQKYNYFKQWKLKNKVSSNLIYRYINFLNKNILLYKLISLLFMYQ